MKASEYRRVKNDERDAVHLVDLLRMGRSPGELRALLHAAVLDGAGTYRLYAWSTNPVAAEEATTTLLRHHDTADG